MQHQQRLTQFEAATKMSHLRTSPDKAVRRAYRVGVADGRLGYQANALATRFTGDLLTAYQAGFGDGQKKQSASIRTVLGLDGIDKEDSDCEIEVGDRYFEKKFPKRVIRVLHIYPNGVRAEVLADVNGRETDTPRVRRFTVMRFRSLRTSYKFMSPN